MLVEVAQQRLYTAEEFYEMGDQFEDYELERGVPVPVSPANFPHGRVAFEIGVRLRDYARPRKLGVVSVEAGYVVESDPDTVRGPDVSFVKAERLKQAPRRGFWRAVPDIAIEVLSPRQPFSTKVKKVSEYLAGGCPLVWFLDPERRQIDVFLPSGDVQVLKDGDVLDGGEVLPGFSCPVTELFDEAL